MSTALGGNWSSPTVSSCSDSWDAETLFKLLGQHLLRQVPKKSPSIILFLLFSHYTFSFFKKKWGIFCLNSFEMVPGAVSFTTSECLLDYWKYRYIKCGEHISGILANIILIGWRSTWLLSTSTKLNRSENNLFLFSDKICCRCMR